MLCNRMIMQQCLSAWVCSGSPAASCSPGVRTVNVLGIAGNLWKTQTATPSFPGTVGVHPKGAVMAVCLWRSSLPQSAMRCVYRVVSDLNFLEMGNIGVGSCCRLLRPMLDFSLSQYLFQSFHTFQP